MTQEREGVTSLVSQVRVVTSLPPPRCRSGVATSNPPARGDWTTWKGEPRPCGWSESEKEWRNAPTSFPLSPSSRSPPPPAPLCLPPSPRPLSSLLTTSLPHAINQRTPAAHRPRAHAHAARAALLRRLHNRRRPQPGHQHAAPGHRLQRPLRDLRSAGGGGGGGAVAPRGPGRPKVGLGCTS
jgi:hypothetical protein